MGGEILTSAGFCGIILFFAGRKFLDERVKKTGFIWGACLLFFAALTLRLVMGYYSDGFSTDLDTFKSWASITNQVGFSQIYRQDIFLDYPPGYLYVLAFLDKLRLALNVNISSQAATLIIKLPSIFADLCCAGVLLYLGKKRLGDKSGLMLAGAYLFCPAVLVNSAQWGQADSFCTGILLASLLLLYREKYELSAVIYGIAIACKPQMLIFAPAYLFFTINQKRWIRLITGVACAISGILLVSLPFTHDFNFMWLLNKYRSTLEYYDYYSVNAYNFWSLIGNNWKNLPQGIMEAVVTFLAPVTATVVCGFIMLRSKRKDSVFAGVFVLMTVMYAIGIKMHERYLFPALLFILLAFIFVKDKGLLRAFGLVTAANYLNVTYVLWLFQEKQGSYDPNSHIVKLLSVIQLLCLGYLLYAAIRVYVAVKVREAGKPETAPLWETRWVDGRMRRHDVIIALTITIFYSIFAFWNLGTLEMPQTSWTPSQGESVVLKANESCAKLIYLPGVAADGNNYSYRVGVNVSVSTSSDGVSWVDCGTLTDGSVFAWAGFELKEGGTFIRLTALDDNVTINEVGAKGQGNSHLEPLSLWGESGQALVDEQQMAPLYTTYENSSYFDEIYHARTAYEHILGLEPYENTHPPLGKYIIAAGIGIFGLNPFGWRFMGALFGVLMLPVFYHLLKQLLGKPWLCGAGTLLFAFDFMHFTQTRIATIDTYAVFFLLLMYDSMVAFIKKDVASGSNRELLPPLLLCGIFTGLGISSKWTAAYGAIGLAVLFFGKLALSYVKEKREKGDTGAVLKKSLKLCLWCCLFFILMPFAIYFSIYLPLTCLPHNVGDVLGNFWSYQNTMYGYHSQLKAEHFFSSPWYEWPLVIKPIWYFSGDTVNAQGQYSTISAMGNPLLWWACIPGIIGAAVLWARERRRACAVAVIGFLSVYLPWVMVARLTFIYHYFIAVPFLIIALMAMVNRMSESRLLSKRIRLGGAASISGATLVLGVFTALCLALFVIYFPVISGAPTSRSYVDKLELFGTWYFG